MITLTVACLSSACGAEPNETASASAGKGELHSLAFGSAADSQAIYKSLGDQVVAYGKARDVKMFRYDNALDPSKALSNAQLMVAQHPDVIADAAAGDVNTSVGKVFNRAGIPCIGVVLEIPGCAFLNFNRALSGESAAKATASAANSKGWEGEDTTVILDMAALGGAPLYVYSSSFYQTYADRVPGIAKPATGDLTLSTTTIGKSLVQVDGKGTLDGSNTAIKQALARIPDDRHLVVVTTNDDMALGAISALDQAGRKGDYLITSQGADPQALAHLRANGAWVAEGDPTFAVWPRYIFAMARALKAGEKLPAQTDSPQLTLTPANVDKYYRGSKLITDPPVPASDSYLEPYLGD